MENKSEKKHKTKVLYATVIRERRGTAEQDGIVHFGMDQKPRRQSIRLAISSKPGVSAKQRG